MTEKMKHILVAVAGETPAIITETLWHLTQKQHLPICEVHVLTTSKGKKRIEENLLDPKTGYFYRFCEEYGYPKNEIRFGKSMVKVFKDKRKNLADIRTDKDNEAAADQIAAFIREKTALEDVIVHCSLAGGRKTMSTYVGFAMQLYARPKDTLSHVLVNPPELERPSDFFFPYKDPKGKYFEYANGKKKERLPANKAQVDLTDVPFVRLRHRLGSLFPQSDLSFLQMVKNVQAQLEAPNLRIDAPRQKVWFGEEKLVFRGRQMELYQFFAAYKKWGGAEENYSADDKGFVELAKLRKAFDENNRHTFRTILQPIGEKLDGREKAVDYAEKLAQWTCTSTLDVTIKRINSCIGKIYGTGPLYDLFAIQRKNAGSKKSVLWGIQLPADRITIVDTHGDG